LKPAPLFIEDFTTKILKSNNFIEFHGKGGYLWIEGFRGKVENKKEELI